MSQSWIDDQCPSVIICVDIELILIYSLDCDIRMLIYVCFICFVIACVVLRVYKSVVCIGVMLGLGTLAVNLHMFRIAHTLLVFDSTSSTTLSSSCVSFLAENHEFEIIIQKGSRWSFIICTTFILRLKYQARLQEICVILQNGLVLPYRYTICV